MATTTKRQWQDIPETEDRNGLGRWLRVDDGTLKHWTYLADGETIEEALADYASGYESDHGSEIVVTWTLRETTIGTHTFTAR